MSVWNTVTSAWLLNEASGNALETIGGTLTLTDNATVGSASGLVYPLQRDFEDGNSEFFSRASSAALQIGANSGGIVAFLKMESKPGAADMSFVSKDDILSNREYNLGWSRTADRFVFETWRTAGGANFVSVTDGSAPSIATDYMVYAGYDKPGNKIQISKNAGTIVEAAQTGIVQSNSVFRIGAQNVGSNINFFDGLMGPVYFSNTLTFTQEELDYLWNSGAGRQYGTPTTYTFNTNNDFLFDTSGRVNIYMTILNGPERIIAKIPRVGFFSDDSQDGVIRLSIDSNSEATNIKNQNDIGLFISSGSVGLDDGNWVVSQSTVGGDNYSIALSWDGPAYTTGVGPRRNVVGGGVVF